METSDDKHNLPILAYDGDCLFCRTWVAYWRQLTGERVTYTPFQEIAPNYPQVPLERFQQAVQIILPDGQIVGGAQAVFQLLTYAWDAAWLLGLYRQLPGFAPISEWFYRLVADHRDFFYAVTRVLWGRKLEPPTYALVRWLFLRALGLVYFSAFVSLGTQITGLIGSNGILPIGDFLAALHGYFGVGSYTLAPTVFWLNSSDAALQIVCLAGAGLAVLLIFNVAPRPVLILLYLLYLSLVTAGQDFLSFQWDALLLETGFLAIFLSSSSTAVIWLFRWLLFRLMFSSGAVKLLSGDAAWHTLTALDYHFATQPLPTVFGWFMAQLPAWFHRLSTLIVLAIELVVPCLIFTPRHLRFLAAGSIVFLQVLIFLTGNYAFFNLLTMALCLFLLDDAALRRWLPNRLVARMTQASGHPQKSTRTRALALLAASALALVSAFQLIATLSNTMPEPVAAVLSVVAPFRIVNSYGLFAVMTTARPEISVEGSNDGQTWLAYDFQYKPGDVRRPPRWVQPFQPRLDWQLWFAALGSYQENRWFVNFARRLLQGSPAVLALLDRSPFPGAPPRYIRARLYAYQFTDWATLNSTGAWWQRTLTGEYLPAISLTVTP